MSTVSGGKDDKLRMRCILKAFHSVDISFIDRLKQNDVLKFQPKFDR